MDLQHGRGARLNPAREAIARLTARHVGELCAELHPLLSGHVVRDVAALPPRDLLIVFVPEDDPEAGVLRLRLSVDPDAARLHLQAGRVRPHRGPTGPFYQRLCDELSGARLERIEQVAGDRIVRLVFRESASEGTRMLLVELAGRHGNFVLTDAEDVVLAMLVAPPAGRKKKEGAPPPRLVPGAPWTLPPGKPPSDPGLPLLETFPAGDGPDSPGAPLSHRVEAVLGGLASEREEDRDRRSLAERLKRKKKGVDSLLRGLERRREAARTAERVRQDGELLKSALGSIRRGMKEIVVEDWFGDAAPRAIPLDPKLSPQDNLERIFARYRKLARSGEAIEREEELARARLELYASLLERVAEEDPAALEAEAIDAGLLEARQRKTRRDPAATRARIPYKSYRGSNGTEIRVGKSARDNDLLCSRHARGNDLWLHTADAPGSHVVLPLAKGAEPNPEEVLDAAHLAVHFSPLRGADKASVHVARRKEVHKPKGAPPGLVTLSGGRTLDLRVEPDRLRRLLRTSERGPG